MNDQLYRRKIQGGEQICGDIVKNKIDAVLEWAGDHGDFDDSFVRSLQKSFKQYKGLTSKQYESLNSIIDKFNIDIEEYGAKHESDND